jgi:hypothetical protein
MDDVAKLMAMEGVRRAKAEYFRCIDEQDWDGLVKVFTPDATTDFREGVEPHNSDLLEHDPRAFAQTNSYVLAGVTSAHFGFMPLIEITSGDAASAVWSMEDILWIPEGHEVLPAGTMHGWGHYHDEYKRDGDRWLISSTRLTRIKLEHVS